MLCLIMMCFTCRKFGGERCVPESRNVTSKLPPFFDWLKLATYEGQKKIKEMNYDFWGLTVSDYPKVSNIQAL